MSELVLYTNPMSRGRTARWMLEEVGASYRAVLLDYEGAMGAPEHLRLNPMGKVPVLVDDGQVVTETAAICLHLADRFPEVGLAPAPGARGRYYRAAFFAAGPLEAAISNRALGVEVSPEKARMVGYGTFARTMDALETMLTEMPFAAGDRFTAADVVLGSQILFGLRFSSIERRPAFERYAVRIADRPALARAASIDDALLAEAKR
ncbi:glutathione S-transferase family protein [Aureimonas jatrophae]|uniref:Glutathione S-transferase n=1 Tax=Aureimonas jatrophae TaxID=1166073 RepID=A0A1H0EM56_9HYPH|nr:glutathione S-transferase family protein [Aureimonas jatrophae]MBB3950433.1 glutathione S-transferase [Aureimonas jatrophae]SDN83379.1 glutathione S-transferase [Aureimonas jatrophae]